tara:strand:+ start:3143 stop:4054 length:912 start_codon:yes stop_codon:yes gene_type:complete
MGLKVLIIGYGSIGRKHANLLRKLKSVSSIYILTKQKCKKFKKLNSLKDVKIINPDYIIISSRSNLHYKYLNYLDKIIKNKIILVEKPLFHKNFNLKIKNNKVFVGYNLRFHPVINFIKRYIKNKNIFLSNITCKSYLPNWRKNRSYMKSNSAKKSYGGGVLLELSHEIDYINWMFDGIKKIDHAKISKISNLKIDTEDYAFIEGKSLRSYFNLELNFFSKLEERKIAIYGKNFSIIGDLINNKITISDENRNKKILNYNLEKNYTYIKEHRSILSNDKKIACSYKEGKKIMFIIDKIRKFNK